VTDPRPHPHLRVERTGDVTTVTIDRPERKNACTGDMWVHLGDAFTRIGDSGTRAVVLTGAGTDFCAGADLSGGGDGGADLTGAGALAAMRVLGEAMTAIHRCPVPVIAKVDGVCVGAGLGLALAADLLWCSERARFSAIFARRGLSLDFGTSWLLRQRIGVHLAKQMTLTAEMIPAERAYAHYRFVNEVVPAADLDDAVSALATTIAAGPPVALSLIKRQIDHAGSASLAQMLETEALAQTVTIGTADMREALTAFFERREPRFEGR
jgi:enoyl-CoA hydratase/carnithine racemase